MDAALPMFWYMVQKATTIGTALLWTTSHADYRPKGTIRPLVALYPTVSTEFRLEWGIRY